jgi:hypothetical protein
VVLDELADFDRFVDPPTAPPVATAGSRPPSSRRSTIVARLLRAAEHTGEVQQAALTRAFTLHGDIPAHPIDELDEAGIGTHLLPQDRIGLEEAVVAASAVVRTLKPLECSGRVLPHRRHHGELDA